MKLPVTPDEFLDNLRHRLSIPSDYQAAKVLTVSRSALSTWRTQRDCPSDEVALLLARFLDLPPEYILARCHEVRAARSGLLDVRRVWSGIAEYYAGMIRGQCDAR